MAIQNAATGQSLKELLDQKVRQYNSLEFIATDPVSIPHLFSRKEDIEISGFLAAILSWGQRATIVNNSRRLMGMMDSAPYEFISGAREDEYIRFLKFVHRTFNGEDCIFMLQALRNLYASNKDMEEVFRYGFEAGNSVLSAIAFFRYSVLKTPHLPRSEKHISDPFSGSAGKRLNMFLRWMVRADNNGVDFGIWKSIPPSSLMCPLDVHSGRVARKLGLLKRKQDDWRSVEELTSALKNFDSIDPVKYDFALFGLGVFERY
ncbi:MAG: TIGR02757 family protein [Bacteroidetes bacterium]|nr:TIGR02757 family protein [Bacteroidota bacterium]